MEKKVPAAAAMYRVRRVVAEKLSVFLIPSAAQLVIRTTNPAVDKSFSATHVPPGTIGNIKQQRRSFRILVNQKISRFPEFPSE